MWLGCVIGEVICCFIKKPPLKFLYLEFKLHSKSPTDFPIIVALIEKTIQPHLLGNGQQTASAMLQQQLTHMPIFLSICDQATGGEFEATIKTPQNHKKLLFTSALSTLPETIPHIEIKGLIDYWEENHDVTQTNLSLSFVHNKQERHIKIDVPFRGKRVIQYAVEFICSQVLEFLSIPKTSETSS